MLKAVCKYIYLLLCFAVFSYVLNKIIINGNDLMAKAADTLLSGKAVDFKPLFAAVLWMTLIAAAAAYLKSICQNHYSALVQRQVRKTLGRHLMELPFSYFDTNGTGNILNRLVSDMDEMGRFFSEIMPSFIVNVITVAVTAFYIARMDTLLTAVLLITYPVMLIIADKLSKKLAAIAKKLRTHMDELTKLAYDAVQGIVVGRSYNLYDMQNEKINSVIDKMVQQACKSTRISSLSWLLNGVITNIPVVLCYLSALHEVLADKITVGEMLAFTVLLGRVIYPIGDIVFSINDIRTSGVSLKRLQEIYGQNEETGGNFSYTPSAADLNETNVIEWENIDFKYNKASESNVLNKAAFTIKAGENIAFAGCSGEGKTTIFKLLCGFYGKTSGNYNLFGHSFDDWDLGAARACFSLVSQNVFLFPDTIRQNVACGKENASEEEIINACKDADIHDFIMQLPLKYDTRVGERGVKLSGGQRQRISIARAILKNAPVLLLDEPTASVDVETEMKLQEAIERISKGKTVITIAHRLSTIKNADRIYVLNNGGIAECGNHEELIKNKGIYYALYQKDSGSLI